MWASVIRAVVNYMSGRLSGTDTISHDQLINTIVGAIITGLTLWWSYRDRAALAKKAGEEPPKINLTPLILLAFIPFLFGCASYRHSREADPTTGKVVETTSVRAPWLTKNAVNGLRSRTTDQHGKDVKYSRSIGVDSATNEADVEGINALKGLLGELLIQGLKTAPKP